MAAPIYKQSAITRIVFCALAALAAMTAPGLCRAEANPAYTVEGVEVDVTDKNAVAAREKALEQAQVKAYQMLTERFLGAEGAAAAKATDPLTISTLVQDFEVTKEQLSSRRYKGTFTVRFRPTAMKSQMAARGQVFSDQMKKPVLVLPFYQVGGQTVLWSEANPFMRAWRAAPADANTLQPSVVPLGDAADMGQLDDGEGLGYEAMRVQELASRYGADDVAVLVATTEPTQTAQGRVSVNIYNNGFDGPTLVQKIAIDQQPGEGEDAVYARAVQKVKTLLRQNWKANAAYAAPSGMPPASVVTTTTESRATTYGSAPGAVAATRAAPIPYTRQALGPSQTYGAYARFSSVQEWVRMKNTLDRTYGVQAVMVKALKPREAIIDIRYAGNVTALQLALQNAGISLRAGAGGVLELSSGAAPRGVYR